MLKQIIGNLSSSDKFSLLTQSQKDYVEKLSSELHSEVDLTNMLYESAGLKLLLEERSRNILLQRMTPLQVREVIENVSIEGIEYNESDTRQNYEVLREISERCPNDFYRALGIGEVVEQFDSLKEKVQGTKKASVAYPLS